MECTEVPFHLDNLPSIPNFKINAVKLLNIQRMPVGKLKEKTCNRWEWKALLK